MINRVVMVGRMTRDPELRRTQNGSAVTSFTLAINRPKRNDEYVTEVVCESVQFLESKPRDKYEEQQYHSQSTYNPNQYQQPQNQQQDSFMNENPPFNIMEDDIQF